MKKAALALVTAATIGVSGLVAPSPAQAWRGGGWGGGWGAGLAAGLIGAAVAGGIASSAYAYGPGYGYYGGPGYGYYGGYAPRITAATPRHTTTTATPPHTTADTGLTMLVPRIGALFAPHTPTALGTIAGMAIAGDRQRRRRSLGNERSRGGRLFRGSGCLSVHSERRDDHEH